MTQHPSALTDQELAALDADWSARWPGCRPVGDELRRSAVDRWVRFHSLPAGRRVPSSTEDYETLLDRHHQALARLAEFGADGNILAITSSSSRSPEPSLQDDALAEASPGARWWQTVEADESDPDAAIWSHLYVDRLERTPQALDPLLRLVADDATHGVVLTDEHLTWLYHPYDGGADIIAPSTGTARELSDEFGDWLSDHPEGL